MPTISVILPTYNREAYLAESIDSIIGQTYKDWELIVVDDGSTDNTADLLHYYRMKDQRVQAVHLKQNEGIAAARNMGLNFSNGQYIAVMDSDDLCHPKRLAKSLKAIKDVDFVYADYLIADPHATVQYAVQAPDKITKQNLYDNASAPHVTIMAKRSCFENTPYRTECTVNDDSLLLWDWFRAGYQGKRIREPMVIVRVHPGRVSDTKQKEVDRWTKIMRKEMDAY